MVSDIRYYWPDELKDMAIQHERLTLQVQCLRNQAAACLDLEELSTITDQLIAAEFKLSALARKYFLAKLDYSIHNLYGPGTSGKQTE